MLVVLYERFPERLRVQVKVPPTSHVPVLKKRCFNFPGEQLFIFSFHYSICYPACLLFCCYHSSTERMAKTMKTDGLRLDKNILQKLSGCEGSVKVFLTYKLTIIEGDGGGNVCARCRWWTMK